MYYPSPSPSHASLPSSSSASSSSRFCSTPTPTPTSTSSSYYTSFSSSAAHLKASSSSTSKSGFDRAATPRAPFTDCLPLPSVAEYRSGLSTPTASPAPSSRRLAPSPVKFNPILTTPSPSSRFDFSNPNAATNTYSHDPAFASGQLIASYIPILCGPLNLLVYIHNPSSQMSCRDFLLAISAILAQPVNPYTDEEWLQVGPHNQQSIMKAYQQRVTFYPDSYVRKIDFMLNQTRFKGLRFVYNAWALVTE